MTRTRNLRQFTILALATFLVLLALSTASASPPLEPDAQGLAAGTLTVSPATMTFAPPPILSGSIGLSQAQETETPKNAGVRARGRGDGYLYAGLDCVVVCAIAAVLITIAR